MGMILPSEPQMTIKRTMGSNPSLFVLGSYRRERLELAAQLIATGSSVRVDGFDLHLEEGTLIVSILTESAAPPGDAETLLADCAARVEAFLASNAKLSTIGRLPRTYELVTDWNNGATRIGYWVGTRFELGRRQAAP